MMTEGRRCLAKGVKKDSKGPQKALKYAVLMSSLVQQRHSMFLSVAPSHWLPRGCWRRIAWTASFKLDSLLFQRFDVLQSLMARTVCKSTSALCRVSSFWGLVVRSLRLRCLVQYGTQVPLEQWTGSWRLALKETHERH
mmetsp:Transcript_42640/g.117631  ORF Transcript_42640/g.117631 Transcript_42640/m.117631 type:complete len:139 (-) Transcript_42640:372-788(-)